MKRTFALLLSGLLALSLTACGKETVVNKPATSSAGNGVLDSGTSSKNGTTSKNETTKTNPTDNNRVDNGATGTDKSAADNNTLGLENKAAGTPNTGTKSTAVPQKGILHGASYGQMLRNARVHDTDGFLFDNENSVTPAIIR